MSTLSLLQFFYLRSSFPTWHWFLWWMVIVILCIHLYISPVLVAIACPVSSLLLWSKESCWVFHLFSFLLVFRTKGWLPISLHVELETQVHSFFFFFFHLTHMIIDPLQHDSLFLMGRRISKYMKRHFKYKIIKVVKRWAKCLVEECSCVPSHVWLFAILCIVDHQVSLSMDLCRQGYWNGLPFPTPEDLLNPKIKPTSLPFPALAVRFVITAPPRKLCRKDTEL